MLPSTNNLTTSDAGVANDFNEYFSGISASMKDQIGARTTFDPG